MIKTNNIRKIREEIGITQVNLSEKTGLSVGYICHLEKGSRSNPSFRTMKKIANALNKSINEVFNTK